MSGSKVLSITKCDKKMDKIRSLLDIDKESFDILYLPMFESYAEHCQLLKGRSNWEEQYLVQVGVERAHKAIESLVNRDSVDIDARFSYALLCLCLFYHIGFVNDQRDIVLCEEDGSFIKKWNYTVELIGDCGFYYRVVPTSYNLRKLPSKVTPLIAWRLIPQMGQAWLFEDVFLFNDLIGILGDYEDEGGDLRALFNSADEYLQKNKDVLFDKVNISDYYKNISIEKQHKDFIKWLQSQINTGKITLMLKVQCYIKRKRAWL